MKEIILVKYGEIALKGLNKSTFEDMLQKNIKRRLKKLGTFGYSVRKDTPGKRSNSLKGDDRKKKSRKNKSFPQKPSRVKEKLPGQKGILQQKNMKTDQNNFR